MTDGHLKQDTPRVREENIDSTGKRVTLLVTTLGAFLTPYMSSAVNIAFQ